MTKCDGQMLRGQMIRLRAEGSTAKWTVCAVQSIYFIKYNLTYQTAILPSTDVHREGYVSLEGIFGEGMVMKINV